MARGATSGLTTSAAPPYEGTNVPSRTNKLGNADSVHAWQANGVWYVTYFER